MDGGTADVRQEDIEIDDVDEDEYEQDAGGSVLWRRIQDSITGRYRVMGPIALLVLLFSFGMGMLLVLDAQISSRSEGREAKWVSIRNTCTATMQMIPKGSISNGARVTADYVTSGVGTVWRKLFRSAWKDTTLDTSMFLTRGELETDILPRLLAAARETASQEAARISKDVPDVGRSQDDDNQFMAFAERYAGDKDLPADYALASTGGTILSCTPSTVLSYARFARQYAQALVTERNRLQLPPRARVILTPEILPGNCWGFRGDRGDVTIGLARPTVVKSVTVEHTPRGSVFSMKSALRRFRVTGLKVGGGTAELGEFMFDAEKETRGHLQSFAVKSGGGKLRAVKVEILSNHGAKNTCVYRVRVHGEGEGLE